MQSTIMFLQQELKTVRDENQHLKQINQQLNNEDSPAINGDSVNGVNLHHYTHNGSSTSENINDEFVTGEVNDENSVRTKSAKQSEIDEIIHKEKSVNEILNSHTENLNGDQEIDECMSNESNVSGKRPLETSDTNIDGINPKRTRRTAAIVAMASIESDNKKLNGVA